MKCYVGASKELVGEFPEEHPERKYEYYIQWSRICKHNWIYDCDIGYLTGLQHCLKCGNHKLEKGT